MMMQNTTGRLIVWAVVVALILLIPLVLTLLGSGVDREGFHWTLFDFVVMGGLLFGVGLAAAFLLGCVNGAVGIIGDEGNPANLMYGAVFAVGFIGSLIARFKPRGMVCTLFAAAMAQMLIPMNTLFIWPQISWSAAGMSGVLAVNAFFVMLFVVSALLFRHAAHEHN